MQNISIILTTYNHKDFIKDTIDSIVNQSFSDWELLIGDDSPNDDTRDVIEGYTEKYKNIHARHHRPNKGIVDNMNFLISKISDDSKYVIFLEGDDVLKPNYIEKKINIFNKYPEVQLVYNNIDFIDKNGKVIQNDIFHFRQIKTYNNSVINPNDYVSASAGPIISWSTVMIRKQLVDSYKIKSIYPQNKNYAISDYDYLFDVSTENKVYYINDSLTLYRRHQSNLSAGNTNLLTQLSSLIELYFQSGKITKKTFKHKLSQNNIMISLMMIEKGNKKEAFRYFRKSIKYDIFESFILKTGAIFLILLPIKISQKILSIIIKRG